MLDFNKFEDIFSEDAASTLAPASGTVPNIQAMIDEAVEERIKGYKKGMKKKLKKKLKKKMKNKDKKGKKSKDVAFSNVGEKILDITIEKGLPLLIEKLFGSGKNKKGGGWNE